MSNRKFPIKISNQFIFYFGLSLKVTCSFFFASYFLKDLFIPFVDYFVVSGFKNPYSQFADAGAVAHFPYPALMLYILSVPKLLLGWLAPNSLAFKLFLYRLPILLADVSIFLILKTWLKKKYRTDLLKLYWISPVLIYISYFHGQLDAIPIAFVFGCLFYLFKNKLALAALCLGAAISTKTNIALVVPFFGLFLLSKKKSLKELSVFFLIVAGVFLLVNWPYIESTSFIKMVFNNQEQSKLFSTYFSINGLLIYCVPAAWLFLFVRGALLKNYNRDIFVMFLGFAFSIILLFIPPMQGWYYWLIPFLSYFYIKESGRSRFLFFALQLFYLVYFAISKSSDYWGILNGLSSTGFENHTLYSYFSSIGFETDKWVNMIFTVLQSTLLINCVWIYRKGLASYTQHKITSSPFLIGIGGNSGVGKTTLSQAFEEVFSKTNTTVLRGDDMHKWQRGHEKWNELTHLDPKANNLHREINYLKKLKNGTKIYRRAYDHNDGKFTPEKIVYPNNIIIFEGLHPFYLPSQRQLYDLKIYVKPGEDLMYHWKIIRDQQKRGYSKDKILQSIKKREKDTEKYIDTQLNKADVVLEIYPDKKISSLGDKSETFDLHYNLKLSNDIYLEPLIHALDTIEGLKIAHEYDDSEQQCLELRGDVVKKSELDKLAQKYIPGLEDLGVNIISLPQGLFGAIVLILTYYIFEKGGYVKD